MATAVMTDAGGKLFVGFSAKDAFKKSAKSAKDEKDEAPQPSAPINDSAGVDPSLVFTSAHQCRDPILTADQVSAVLSRIGDLEDGKIRKLLAQMEGQRWLLPPDPKTELSYRFFGLAQILDLISSEDQK